MSGIRLNRALSLLGICSRRDADKLIEAGEIQVNAVPIKQHGTKISETDVVFFSGKRYSLSQSSLSKKIWIYYKPKGLITTHKDERNRPTVFEDLKKKIKERVISVGRLDLNSEGLLLVTNDNEFAKYAESPKTAWERRYKVRLFGIPSDYVISKIGKGIEIDKIKYGSVKIEIINEPKGKNCWVNCVLKEGKNREIRKLFSHFGIMVNRLIRYRYGPYELGSLAPYQIIKTDFIGYSQSSTNEAT
ncbi:MAG: rRNA pseudouridine synthase [Holosporales bacterium]|jgi:23S rRNA pseudouridine2605 synthase|nr:rRNA pseudouridine synthase [Holosporales bacterium]